MAPSFLVMADTGRDGGDTASVVDSSCITTAASATLPGLAGLTILRSVGTVVPTRVAPVVGAAIVLYGRPTVAASPRWRIFCDVTSATAIAAICASCATAAATSTTTAIVASSSAGLLASPIATAPSAATLAIRLEGVDSRVESDEVGISLGSAPYSLL